jgi:methionyl-tRNA formyltransferase
MRIVFMGTPESSVPVLEKLCEAENCEVVAVYAPPDRPRGRGRGVEFAPVKSAAIALGLPVSQPNSFRSGEAQAELASCEPDVIVVAAYGKLLPAGVLDLPVHGCLNIHPSLLPRYRGPSPVVASILDGVSLTGISLMLLDEGMDTGPVIAQREHALDGTEVAGELTAQLFADGADLLVETLGPWVAGSIKAVRQDETLATITRKLERSDGLAEWGLSAAELERRQRAFTPWPGLFTQWNDRSLRLVEVCAVESLGGHNGLSVPVPGEVVALSQKEVPVGIGTADGILGLKAVQLEGRRGVASAEFIRGYPDFIGSRLGS